MPAPFPMSDGAARVRKRLAPLAVGEDQVGYTVSALASALQAPADPLNDVVRAGEDHEPYEPAVNPVKAPAWVLPWLAAVVGAPIGTVKVGQTVEEWADEARAIIVNRPHWRRGTPLYIRRAVLKTLDATATIEDVRLIERTTGPWDDTLAITASKTPDQSATTAAAMAEKPAMRRWTIVFTNEPTIGEFTRQIGAITAPIDNLTLADVT